ncbi:uncharacterized protein LOC119100085 [Pollicipes pollicipes]|uniref:uncharacterized protein LOC119100085 n=1 Tax=Pollicipes pollicipes TaxID=41117 RepID=UPI0018856E94|nr:uncharacterized protein LOC119100085 [Pollicipes pollicipes]
MEPAGKARRFPHLPLLYALVAALAAAQLAGFLLVRHQLAAADRVCAERALRAERQAVVHVTDFLVKATRGPHAEFRHDEVLTPPPSVRHRRQATDQAAANGAFLDRGPEYTGANVEFVHRTKTERREGTEEGSGAAEEVDPDNPWVWLTSYSRIPLGAMQEFCSATTDYCPPGKAGDQGLPGLPGKMGTKGE